MITIAYAIALMAVSTAIHAAQNSEDALKSVLTAAKVTGSCSMLGQVINFQKATKMPGGDEFIERFYSMELARLGISSEQYGEMCVNAGRLFNEYSKEVPASRTNK